MSSDVVAGWIDELDFGFGFVEAGVARVVCASYLSISTLVFAVTVIQVT